MEHSKVLNVIKKVCETLIIFVMCAGLIGCSSSKDGDSVSREDYDKMMEIISLNDDFDLLDVRSALYSFAPKFLNASTQDEIDNAIEYISGYSTTLLQSSLKISNYTARAEYRDVEGVYYCYPDKSSNGCGKFLVVTAIKNSSGDFVENTRTYMMFSMNSEGKLTQVERW